MPRELPNYIGQLPHHLDQFLRGDTIPDHKREAQKTSTTNPNTRPERVQRVKAGRRGQKARND